MKNKKKKKNLNKVVAKSRSVLIVACGRFDLTSKLKIV